MTKSILAVFTMTLTATACGGGGGMTASAAADANAPDLEAAAPASPVAEPAARPQTAAPAPAQPRRPAAASPARAAAPPAAAPAVERAPVPEYREFTLAAGTPLSLELQTALGSDMSQVEDAVRATLRRPIVIDGREVLAAGTEVIGTVTGAEQSGRVKGRARVAFQFTSLRHDSERYQIRTEPIEQLAEATKGEDAKKVGIGAGAGAALGALMGGGSGAAKGAAIGAAAGTGAVLATRGKEVHLEPGTEVTTQLAAPLAVRLRIR